ncbi:phosphohistidine phosphatase SixA [Rhodococcus wratislaviensis]|uniref:Hydrolase n=1 Tax=Rhodococcus wratislaviensis TaxID=44752 RepID=A0AB38FD08_RHOWR|nr:phosphoglycerate mutase family protein [Rhodococcus wratislaviensis]REE75573.1 phosphohistidine phosphatase SixA [Rhodococcus wratislaviensis]SPZ39391.1 hydrolase [Rhodococcus wratislaviensis]
MFVLVRHAHAGEKKKWDGPDADRPLSPLGHDQAHGLVAALRGIEIATLFSSPTTRCRQTLLPLAEAVGLRVADHPLLAPDATPDELFALLHGPEADGAAFCTHGEILNALAEFARSRGAPDAPPSGATAKGGVWFVDCGAGPPPTLRYLAPIPAG